MPCTDGGIPYPPSPEEVAREKFAKRARAFCVRPVVRWNASGTTSMRTPN